MNNLVLDLVVSCEDRISMVEELVTGAQCATATLDFSLGELANERARLGASLRELLAQNCSLRRRDFDELIESTISAPERKREALVQEQEVARDALKGYLDEQKRLVACLRQELDNIGLEKVQKDPLVTALAGIRCNQDRGARVFDLLRNFQVRLEAFRKEQEEVNRRMQRLVERGALLRLEDLRQLEATRAGEERKAERRLRHQQVGSLLAHFKQRRQLQ